MKLRIISIKQILILFILFFWCQQEANSQGTDISMGNNQSLYAGFSLGPSLTNIINEGTSSVSKLVSDKKISFSGSFDIGYLISKYFGLSSGLGFTSAKTQLTLDAYENKLNTVDSENETYERRITGSDITETQKIGFLYVPVNINLSLPINKKINLFLQTGVSMSVPLINTYNSNGTFSYKGFYPAYNVLLENLPAYGFPNNKSITTEGKLEIKQLLFNFGAAAGIEFFVQEKMQIGLTGCYGRTLSNISDYSAPDKFQLSTDVNQINSLMGGTNKATIQSISLKVSLRYFLK